MDEEVNPPSKTPPGDALDRSGTNPRASLIASLSEHLRVLAAAGDMGAAKVAAETLVHLLGLTPVTDTSARRP
jgi:hypothetical protein